MNCVQHPERNAVDTCAGCGGGVCEFCKTLVEGKVYCPPCVDKMLTSPGAAAGVTPQGSTGAPVPASAASDPFAIMNMKPPAAGISAASPVSRMEQPALMTGEGGSSMAGVLWMLVVAACGGLALGGVFMPWVRFKEWIFTISISGWQATQWDQYAGVTLIEPYLVLAGAAIMVMCALPALVIALTSAESEDTVRVLARISAFGAGMTLGVIIWTIIDMMMEDMGGYISYGVWIILVASIVGLLASGLMSRSGGQSKFYLSE